MDILVLKSWLADTRPVDSENNYVSIAGRRGGILGWLFSLAKVDPTTRFKVGSERIDISVASLAGTETRLIPLESISSTYYGYHKPWKKALAIVVACFFIGLSFAGRSGHLAMMESDDFKNVMVSTAIGIILALVYYFLNRTLTLGLVENSGIINGIQFKRSIIENKDINEKQAASVSVIIQKLVEARLRQHRQ